MDRPILLNSFNPKHSPDWICPTCGKGILRIKKDTFLFQINKCSRESSQEDWWEVEFTESVFTCMLECNNDRCNESVVCSGTGGVKQEAYCTYNNYEAEGPCYEEYFKPQYFEPPLNILCIPSECPDSIRKPIIASFRLFFVSPAAAANHIRIAIEEILTDLKIPVTTTSIDGKKEVPINLHNRIKQLQEQHSDFKEFMLAVKWIGNEGSHRHDTLQKKDVLDVYEMIEHILTEIYAGKSENLKNVAKMINSKKGKSTDDQSMQF